MEHYIVDFNPTILALGPLQIRWYSVMYIIGFIVGGKLLKKLSREGFFKVKEEFVDSFLTHMIVGMLLGARLAYVFIYNWDYYSNHLTELLNVWEGGLSFHGALAGMVVGCFVFARRHKLKFFEVGDCLGLIGTQGLFLGRIGNFINGELYGRRTDSFIGMIFKGGGPYPRHPSQLYEAFIEGAILWTVLWVMRKRVRNYGTITAVFFIGYGIGRYIVEFFRQPDSQLGYYFGGTTTMGQILCLIMVASGIGIYFYAKKRDLKVTCYNS